MADIHIHRDHTLGLARAREVAARWATEAEQQFSMQCSSQCGPEGDVLSFTRSGVKGELAVSATAFTLTAQLGFLLGPFAPTISAQIEKNLDDLLADNKA
jgi:putative polyhydroxyalkanoate system protein